jgi:hypothetical protein
MAKTVTTLAGPIGPSDWLIGITNKAALNAGDNIVVGTETMRALVVGAPGAAAVVYRGARGTNGQAAAGAATLTYGPPTDWGASVGVTSLPMEFEEEAAREIDGEEAEKRQERIEKLAEKKAAEKKAADEKLAKAAAEAAKDAAKDAAKGNDVKPPATHR